MYPLSHNTGPSKQESFRVFGSFGDPEPFRMKSTQLPRPPSRPHFTFTTEPPQTPARSDDKQDGKASASIAATEKREPSDLKKGYGFEYPEESAEANVDPFSYESTSKPRGFAWVGVRKPEGHFEKVYQETWPDPSAESQPTTPMRGTDNDRPRRPIAIPRRLHKPRAKAPIPCSSGGKTTSAQCQTGPSSSARVDFSNPPAPSVEDVTDEEKAQSYVERKPINSHRDQTDSQTTKSVLPSPPPTPPPQAGPSTSSQRTQSIAAATTDDRLRESDTASSSDSETDSDNESTLEVSRLHSWNWPVVSKSGNFEVRSPTPSPAAKKRQSNVRGMRMQTESPVAPQPSPFASLSLAQMKAMATVTPVETAAQNLTPSPAQKQWRPPRFARREGDPQTRKLALTLGRFRFADKRN